MCVHVIDMTASMMFWDSVAVVKV